SNTRSGARIPYKASTIESAQHQAPNASLHKQDAGGHEVDVLHPPGLALQFNAFPELGQLLQRTNDHVGIVSDFARCHKASISPRDVCSRLFPCLASSLSMYWNRNLNFRFARFSADSESIFKYRAILTMTN